MIRCIGTILILCCSVAVFASEPADSIRVNFMKSSSLHNFFVYWDYNYNYEIKKREKVAVSAFYGYERFLCDYFSARVHTAYNFEENLWIKSHQIELGFALNYYIPLGKKLFLGVGGAYAVDAFRSIESDQEEWFNSTTSNAVGILSLDYFIRPQVSIGLTNSNQFTYGDKKYQNRTWLGVRYFIPPKQRTLKSKTGTGS